MHEADLIYLHSRLPCKCISLTSRGNSISSSWPISVRYIHSPPSIDVILLIKWPGGAAAMRCSMIQSLDTCWFILRGMTCCPHLIDGYRCCDYYLGGAFTSFWCLHVFYLFHTFSGGWWRGSLSHSVDASLQVTGPVPDSRFDGDSILVTVLTDPAREATLILTYDS